MRPITIVLGDQNVYTFLSKIFTLGYVRVSRDDQAWENQVLLLKNEGVPQDNIFIDQISGVSDLSDRPGVYTLEKNLETCEGGSVVYVFGLSRIGRSFFETLSKIHVWDRRGIRVVSLSPTERWSQMTDQNLRDLMHSIFAWVAAQERKNLVERTKLGLARARTNGKKLGRPPRQIPWNRVRALQEKQISLSAISRILNIPYTTLYRQQIGSIGVQPPAYNITHQKSRPE